MAAATPTFDPIPSLEVRISPPPLAFGRVRPAVAVGIVFGALGLAALIGLVPSAPLDAASPAAAPAFMSFAVGDVQDRTAVWTAPGGGETVAVLPAGTRVGIGGRVAFGSAWASGVAYWVAADVDGHAVRGFVPAGGVSVTAGEPPTLDYGSAGAAATSAGAALADLTTADDKTAVAASSWSSAPAEGSAAAASLSAQSSASTTSGDGTASGADAGVQAAATTVSIPWLPAPVRSWADLLNAAAAQHGVAADLVAIVLLVESGGHPSARSHVGASGLMQVMPATGADIARQRGIGGFDASQLTDPAVGIDFGAWYLAQQLKAFGRSDDPDWARSVELAAAAYNGGPGAAQRFVQGGALPNETQHYVRWVGGMWRERADAASPTYDAWMAAGGRVLVDKAETWMAQGGR